MARSYYRSIFDELDDLRTYMDSLFQQMSILGSRLMLLPSAEEPAGKALPATRGSFRVDVAEHEDEVVVTADMIPGVAKKDITLDLIDPQALEISCERKEEKKEEREGYYLHERTYGSMARLVPLPKAVTEEGASATFKNGVLEVHLKKQTKEPKTKISID
jgi:HSP20 family protein